jgi:hypothetical protein
VIYASIETAAATLDAHFETDLQALLDAHEVVGADAGLTVYKRRMAEIFVPDAKDGQLPGCGVYSLTGRTRAKVQGERFAQLVLVFDYFARGADPEVLSAQCELAVEALLQTVDRLAGADPADQLVGAGEEEFGISVHIQGTAQADGQQLYEDRVLVTVPVTSRDQGL